MRKIKQNIDAVNFFRARAAANLGDLVVVVRYIIVLVSLTLWFFGMLILFTALPEISAAEGRLEPTVSVVIHGPGTEQLICTPSYVHADSGTLPLSAGKRAPRNGLKS